MYGAICVNFISVTHRNDGSKIMTFKDELSSKVLNVAISENDSKHLQSQLSTDEVRPKKATPAKISDLAKE